MASILLVCTGNVCRSPIAEGLLRTRLVSAFGRDAPDVTSAGTMGWVGSGADPSSIAAAAELGVDISGHRARALTVTLVRDASLVLGMAEEHRDAIARMVPEAAGRTFTLKELVQLLEALPVRSETFDERIAAADGLRRSGGAIIREIDVQDPLGMPLLSFRTVARDLDEWCSRLADGLAGPAQDHAATGVEGRER